MELFPQGGLCVHFDHCPPPVGEDIYFVRSTLTVPSCLFLSCWFYLYAFYVSLNYLLIVCNLDGLPFIRRQHTSILNQ